MLYPPCPAKGEWLLCSCIIHLSIFIYQDYLKDIWTARTHYLCHRHLLYCSVCEGVRSLCFWSWKRPQSPVDVRPGVLSVMLCLWWYLVSMLLKLGTFSELCRGNARCSVCEGVWSLCFWSWKRPQSSAEVRPGALSVAVFVLHVPEAENILWGLQSSRQMTWLWILRRTIDSIPPQWIFNVRSSNFSFWQSSALTFYFSYVPLTLTTEIALIAYSMSVTLLCNKSILPKGVTYYYANLAI